MKKIWIGICIIIVVALGLILVVNKTKKEPEEIRIGAILPLTGEAAEYGVDQQRGILLAYNYLKSYQTDKGEKIKIVIEDSKSTSVDGVNSFNKMRIENVNVILTTLSGVSMSLAPLVDKYEIPMISVAAHTDLTKGHNFIVRMLPTSIYYAKELSHFIKQKMNSPSIGILYANDDFGVSLKKAFTDEYSQIKGNIVSSEAFNKEETYFKTEVTKVLGANPESLFIVGYGKELGVIVRQCREFGFKGKIYSTPEISYPDVLNIAGTSLNGTIFISMWIDESNEQVIKFKESYIKTYGKNPSLDSYLGYDETMMVIRAYQDSKKTKESLRDSLFKINKYSGLTGQLTVETNGDVVFPLVLKTIFNGEILLVKLDK